MSQGDASPAVVERLADGARKLLDLTLRNKLVKFRPTKTMHLRLHTEAVGGMLQELMDGQTKISLEPVEEAPELAASWGMTEELGRTYYAHGEEDPERRIRNLLNEAKIFEGEHGYSALFCAVGIIKWSESADAELIDAPLLLVPVTLARGPRNMGFVVQGTGDPPNVNPAISLKLRDQDIVIPDVDDFMDFDVAQYVAEVHQRFKDPRWSVEPVIWLGMYKFHKFVMYQDLRALLANVKEGGTLPGAVETVIDPQRDDPRLDREPVVDEQELDEHIDWPNAKYILDADPSQIVAIEEVKAGKNLVIQGPPGTGKSQTIANLISELMGQGKNVLFVSEKEAALDVVKRRLDAAGLGTFTLALHGVKSSHDQFRSQMDPVVNGAFRLPPAGHFDLEEFDSSRTRLNDYARMMNAAPQGSDLTVGWALGILAATKQHLLDPHLIGSSSNSPPRREDLKAARRAFDDRIDWARQYGPAVQHPWSWSNIQGAADIPLLTGAVQKLQGVLQRLDESQANYTATLGVQPPESWDDIPNLKAWLQELHSPRELPGLAEHGDLDELQGFAAQSLAQLADILEARDALVAKGLDWQTSQEASGLHAEMDALAKKFLFWLRPQYWRAKGMARAMYTDKPPRSRNDILEDLEMLSHFQEQKPRYDEVKGQVAGFADPGADWDGLMEALTGVTTWLTHIIAMTSATSMPEAMVKSLGDSSRAKEHARVVERVIDAWNATDVVVREIVKLSRPQEPGAFGDLTDREPAVARAFLEWFSHERQTIGSWTTHLVWKESAKGLWLNGLAALEPALTEPSELKASIDFAVAETILHQSAGDFPEIHTFSAEGQERLQERFQKHDALLAQHARHELGLELVQGARRVMESAYSGTPMALIKQELIKKRRRMPIRSLVRQTLPALRQLKPCFMMSPITVSTYLDPDADPFDVLIFDEASQVKPEDALVCLMRAKQVVVVGDSKQLPPTSFFDAAEAEEEEMDVDVLSDMESILDACVGKFFPEKSLRWHYRSRHHSLIEGSNQEFYRNSLLVFHSPTPDAPALGMRLHEFADSVYGEGGQGVNQKEAKEIARLVHDHWTAFGDRPYHDDGSPRTLGVVAFSQAQARAIRDALYDVAQDDTDFQVWTDGVGDEGFFVKNLENVQGDERDRMIVSIGYGRDRHGNIKRNFGPVNKKGGERRLNVLFTRAREQTLVVSNFRASQLNLQGVASHGPHVLKRFLELAETGEWPTAQEGGGETDSPFEDAVLEILQREGYHVTPQVGCSGYRIDLAVHHPERPGEFLMAVECDGATYHSSRVARERDRQRQEVLERMGWEFHRVWSTEWYHRPEQARARLLQALHQAMQGEDVAKEPVSAAPTAEVEAIEIPVDLDQRLEFPEYKGFDPYEAPHYSGVAEIPAFTMAEIIRDIVVAEGPVMPSTLNNRVKESQFQGRLGARAKGAIDAGVVIGLKREWFRKDPDGALWIPGKEVPARHRADMPSDSLSVREVMAGAQEMMELVHEMDYNGALQELRRAFGYSRMGKDMRRTFETAIKQLAKQGIIAIQGDRIAWTKN